MLTLPRSCSRSRFSAAACIAVMALALAGCSAEPTTAPTAIAITPTYHPSPSASASVSDADVEAAIAAYLTYVDAGNAVDLEDPSTIDSALAFTSGAQREFEADFYANLVAQGWRLAGGSSVTQVLPSATGLGNQVGTVLLDVCVNNEDTAFLDAQGQRRVPPGLQAHQAVQATMRRATDAEVAAGRPLWLVTDTTPNEADQSCAGAGS